MTRVAFAVGLVVAVGLLLLAAGCGQRKNVLVPNVPPETSVFVRGPVDTVSHRIHIYWFGTDPDGDVVAYQMRFVPSGGSADPEWNTVYCALPGRCTDSLFTLFTGDSALIHTQFEIRAMDNQGLADPTPAVQRFTLSNLAPEAHFSNKFRWSPNDPTKISDSTFASATVSWTVDDLDGGGPGLRYRLWLDGNEAAYDSMTATTFTVPSARFLQGGRYLSGPRTLYLQAVDDGGRAGPVDATTWFVRAPARRDPVYHRSLLVIDDSRSTAQNNQSVDTLYTQALRRNNFPDSSYAILRLEFSNPFRSAADLRQTLAQFDAVAWYFGYDFHSPGDYYAPTTLKTYQDVVGEFILGGGRMMLEGLNLIEGRDSFGALREDFLTRYANINREVVQFNASFQDSTAGISQANQSNLRLRSSLYADAVVQMAPVPSAGQGISPGLRCFVENDSSQVAYWVLAGQLSNLDPYYGSVRDVPLGISVGRAPGRLIVLGTTSRALIATPTTPFANRPLARLLFGKNGLNGLLSP